MLANPTSATPLGQFVRIIHFFWKPSELTAAGDSNTPLPAQILQNANNTGFVPLYGLYLSPYNVEWSKQYKIWSDKTYSVSTVGNTSVIIDKGYKKLSKTFTCLQPNQGTTTYLYDWIPYVMFIYDSDNTEDHPTINYYSRMNYINF